MRRLFDYEKIYKIADESKEKYSKATPFCNIYFDNLASEELLGEALENFPNPAKMSWYKYDNPLEKKLATPHIELLPDVYREILYQMNSGAFIKFLEKLTGIEGLVADPDFYGGGLHQIERGGKLDVHADFNIHPKLRLHRRVNVIVYLNKNWQESYGGYLELWNKDMTAAEQRILPLFNRMAIFNITDTGYHGHPDPLNCPEGQSRKSLALYYYSSDRPEHEKSAPHSTIYKKRPQDPDDDSVEQLRAQRAKGRLVDMKTK